MQLEFAMLYPKVCKEEKAEDIGTVPSTKNYITYKMTNLDAVQIRVAFQLISMILIYKINFMLVQYSGTLAVIKLDRLTKRI